MFKNILTMALVFTVMTISLSPTYAIADINLKFGIYATDLASSLVKKFNPILKKLESNLSQELNEKVTIKLVISKSYGKGISSLEKGLIDFSRLGPASYVLSKNNEPKISILVLESKKGKKIFYGIICVNNDSKIQSINDLKGKSFAFGNKKSTIGRYLSQQKMVASGLYASDLSHYQYLGRHDKVGFAVATKRFDAGALKESTFKKLVKHGKPIRSIAKFENVTKPWVASPQLPSRIKSALTKALLQINTKKFSFIQGDDEDFSKIRNAINQNPVFFK